MTTTRTRRGARTRHDRIANLAIVAAYLAALALLSGAYLVFQQQEGLRYPAVRLGAFVLLASLPGWLYFRFVRVKLDTLHDEFLLNLWRLQADTPVNLPPPPRHSVYYPKWQRAVGVTGTEPPSTETTSAETVYEKKFRTYYGMPAKGDSWTGWGSIFPVAIATFVFAIGWLTVLLDPTSLISISGTPDEMLRFGFLGAYVFSIQLLLVGFYQNDLRSGTYLGAVVRLVVSLIVVLVVDSVWPDGWGAGMEAAVAFVIGSFPVVGQQWVQQIVAARLQQQVPSLQRRYPLSEIDGLNVYYEARLLEEGCDDMQNLATANLIDVIMHTRVPVGRLMDWVDQALLLLHLEPSPTNVGTSTRTSTRRRSANGSRPAEGGEHSRDVLRKLGIRTATDLQQALAPVPSPTPLPSPAMAAASAPSPGPATAPSAATSEDEMLRAELADVLKVGRVSRLQVLVKTLSNEPNLHLVRNWKAAWQEEDGSAPAPGRPTGAMRPAPRAGRTLRSRQQLPDVPRSSVGSQ